MAAMERWAGRRPWLSCGGSRTHLVGATMLEQNNEWSLNRCCMQLEGLQTLSDTVPTRLAAVGH